MKINKLYNTKGAYEIKDLDSENRQVAVYLSKFDTIDSDGDLIRPGAFSKSIQERGPMSSSNRKIAFLRHHEWTKQIGIFTEIAEDSNGLFAVGKLGRSTDGEDAYRDYADGIIKEHSIGFQYIADKMGFVADETIKGDGYNEIRELILWEGSAVTFGSNPFTHVVEVKGQDRTDQIQNIETELGICIRALSNGKGTDERLHNIEMKVKYLSAQLVLLASKDPAPVSQSPDVKSADAPKSFDWTFVVKSMEQKATFSDYPEQAKKNAKRGIELNAEQNNRCATAVGKKRGQQIAQGQPLSLDVLKRSYSFLSRAETYYDPQDPTACGTISYLLWGGKSMLTYCKTTLAKLEAEKK
tara:strand:- start:610 stop:1674 length:1065 start_codon:yes stop_codon:yes gene_type:complete